jgi:lipoprotein signal peptidase
MNKFTSFLLQFKNVISTVLIVVGILAVTVGGIGNVIYQLTEYGKYIDFVLYNHWTTWTAFAGAGSVVIGYIIYSL